MIDLDELLNLEEVKELLKQRELLISRIVAAKNVTWIDVKCLSLPMDLRVRIADPELMQELSTVIVAKYSKELQALELRINDLGVSLHKKQETREEFKGEA